MKDVDVVLVASVPAVAVLVQHGNCYFLLIAGDPPTFRAHKVELENSLAYRRRYKVIDGSGDALVIQVTNNENRFIHVCVISYQADGSIVVLHPPRKVSIC